MTGRKRLVEETPRLDIRDLHRRRLLRAGACMFWGHPTNPVMRGVIEDGTLQITFTAQPDKRHRVRITAKKTSRSWFLYWTCPAGCGRTVRDIYIVNLNIACRRCANLGYRSSLLRRDPQARAEHVLGKLADRLLGDPRSVDPPDPPLGMRPSEYKRLAARWRNLQARKRQTIEDDLARYRKLVLCDRLQSDECRTVSVFRPARDEGP